MTIADWSNEFVLLFFGTLPKLIRFMGSHALSPYSSLSNVYNFIDMASRVESVHSSTHCSLPCKCLAEIIMERHKGIAIKTKRHYVVTAVDFQMIDLISWDSMKMGRLFCAYHIGYCVCFPIFHSLGDR